MSDDVIAIGRVRAAFGARGEVKVVPLGRFPERFRALQRVLVGESRVSTPVERVRLHGGAVVLKLVGIDSLEAAKALQQQYLYVPESEAVGLPPGEYFVWQIVGLRVRTADGEDLGRIVEVLSTGSNDVYVVRGPRGEVLVPALKDVIEGVDLQSGWMTVALPAGLLEE